MRVLVCGGRDYDGVMRMAYELYILSAASNGGLTVIHGGARGADALAGDWAARNFMQSEVYKADWNKHGKAAGPIRNRQMLDDGKPDLVLAFPGGRGTADMIRQARKAGVAVREIGE